MAKPYRIKHKDYKPNLMDKRKFMAELRRDSNIMIKTF